MVCPSHREWLGQTSIDAAAVGRRTHPLCWQTRQHILEVGVGIMPVHTRRLDKAHNCSRTLATVQRPGNQPVGAPEHPRPYRVFDRIVVDGHSTIIQVAHQRYQAFQAVVRRLGRTLAHVLVINVDF